MKRSMIEIIPAVLAVCVSAWFVTVAYAIGTHQLDTGVTSSQEWFSSIALLWIATLVFKLGFYIRNKLRDEYDNQVLG